MAQQKEEKIDVKVQDKAYRKIIYHIVRYPTSKVTGALIGKGKVVEDAYPLFHTPLVNPTLSVALDLIQSNLTNSQEIIGFYEFVQGSQPKIYSIIQNNSATKNMIGLRIFMNSQKKIKFASAKYAFILSNWQDVIVQGLKNGQYRFIVDFDAHFQEIQLDFRNGYVQ